MVHEPKHLADLIDELHDALYATAEPDKKELYNITLRLARQVQRELARLDDKMTQAIARKQDRFSSD